MKWFIVKRKEIQEHIYKIYKYCIKCVEIRLLCLWSRSRNKSESLSIKHKLSIIRRENYIIIKEIWEEKLICWGRGKAKSVSCVNITFMLQHIHRRTIDQIRNLQEIRSSPDIHNRIKNL